MSLPTMVLLLPDILQISTFCAVASSAAFLLMCKRRKKAKPSNPPVKHAVKPKPADAPKDAAKPNSKKKDEPEKLGKLQKEVKISSNESDQNEKLKKAVLKVENTEDSKDKDAKADANKRKDKATQVHGSDNTAVEAENSEQDDVDDTSEEDGISNESSPKPVEEQTDDKPKKETKIDVPKVQTNIIQAVVLKGHSGDPREFLSTNIKEYRFAMPLTLDEYERGQRRRTSEERTILKRHLTTWQMLHGTFTRKIYHLKTKAPWFMQKLFPEEAFNILEESWNAFPYTKTVLTNPGYMKEKFHIIIETLHTDEDAILQNALNLSEQVFRKREIVNLNIYNEHDLKEADIDTAIPKIRLYKVCHVYFKWFGLQNKVERGIQESYPRLFTKFNREMFCWIDEWHGKSSEELEQYEKEAAEKLRELFVNGSVVGMQANDLS
uniref:Phosphatidylinositol transfer protein N-terminal domain-containing protein n=1 Tax=Ditylenchus dipsaci TaxID=166011 RepID=A0A915D0J5_9BILA